MLNNFQILEFEFEAHAEIVVVKSKDNETFQNVDSKVKELNESSDTVAKQIQQEIRRALPPRVRVEVDIQFYEGSIIAMGTAILLFLQPIVEAAGKKALEKSFEEGFTRIIQFAVRRILSRYLRGVSLSGPLEIDIQPPGEGINTIQRTASVPFPVGQANPTGNLVYLLPLTAANTVLLIVLLTLASRFLALP